MATPHWMTRKAEMPRNRARMPSERRKKTAYLTAKVYPETRDLVQNAADIKGWPRQRVVEEGAVQYAQLIVVEFATHGAVVRKAMRKAKARLGGLARHRKAKVR